MRWIRQKVHTNILTHFLPQFFGSVASAGLSRHRKLVQTYPEIETPRFSQHYIGGVTLQHRVVRLGCLSSN